MFSYCLLFGRPIENNLKIEKEQHKMKRVKILQSIHCLLLDGWVHGMKLVIEDNDISLWISTYIIYKIMQWIACESYFIALFNDSIFFYFFAAHWLEIEMILFTLDWEIPSKLGRMD